MSEEMNIPAEVVAEIEAGRKVNAIKLLRAKQGIGLKEAKDAVDAYILEHPRSQGDSGAESRGGSGFYFMLAVPMVAAYAL